MQIRIINSLCDAITLPVKTEKVTATDDIINESVRAELLAPGVAPAPRILDNFEPSENISLKVHLG